MKPNWSDAPSWANYLARDASGQWTWFEDEPLLECRCWMPRGLMKYASNDIDWRDTLEERPVEAEGRKE